MGHGGREHWCDTGQFLSFARGRDKLHHLLSQEGDVFTRAILKHERHATARADSGNGRRRKGKRTSCGNFRELDVHVFENCVVLLFRRFALGPFLQRNEKDPAVGRIDAAEKVQAGNGRVIFDPGSFFEDLFALTHHFVGALKRSGVGQDDLREKISLIFLRQEASGNRFSQHDSKENHAAENQDRDQRFANQEMTSGRKLIGGNTEDPIEPVKKSLEEAAAFFLRL